MRRLILMGATALMLFMASMAQAQEMMQPSQLSSLFARTEARAKEARRNFERLIAYYPEFLPELQRVAARLGTRPEWLLNVMACESSFVASAHNPLPGQTASGLLQFIRQTAVGLGTTTAAVRRMTPVEQLRFVEKYFTPFKGQLNSLADVYLAVFRGFIIEGGPETVVAPLNSSSKERQAYSLNKGLDLNGDRQITKDELALIAFGVGRFSGAQRVAESHPQNNAPPQRDIPVPPQLQILNRYVVIPASTKSEQPSSPTKPFGASTVIHKTRSTYIH
ncbi:MAG TPA: transglycosylase SLT domain-containing protein [Blastocatellia bacterium]|nr:transglycosylase SLT domain-containing protein [Blastocatellia bacterium]